MEILKSNRDAVCACSLSGRDFRSVAQPFLGRHISVTDHGRVKECIQILNDSGFQHVRSLSLGITDKRVILEEYWTDYLVILGVFAKRGSLVQLWLWEVPFFFLQPQQEKMTKEVVLALSSSVDNLGLYGCHFSCSEEMVSFVRAFPHCNKLYIQDCVTGGQDSPENSFAGFPQHKLSIVDLDLTASSTSELLIDLSGFIEDAELDVSSLSGLACDLQSTEGNNRVVLATSESPIRSLRFSSTSSDGFQGAYIPLFFPPSSLTFHHHRRVHNFNTTSVGLGILSHRTHVPQSRYHVLGGRTQEFPQTPSLDQSPNHLSLPHAFRVQRILLARLRVPPLRQGRVPAFGGCGRLSNAQVTTSGLRENARYTRCSTIPWVRRDGEVVGENK